MRQKGVFGPISAAQGVPTEYRYAEKKPGRSRGWKRVPCSTGLGNSIRWTSRGRGNKRLLRHEFVAKLRAMSFG
jgi:hypothetical protein